MFIKKEKVEENNTGKMVAVAVVSGLIVNLIIAYFYNKRGGL